MDTDGLHFTGLPVYKFVRDMVERQIEWMSGFYVRVEVWFCR